MSTASGCSARRDGEQLEFPIGMAFQPILDLARPAVLAHEALVRSATAESVGSLLTDFQPDLIKLDMALIRDIN